MLDEAFRVFISRKKKYYTPKQPNNSVNKNFLSTILMQFATTSSTNPKAVAVEPVIGSSEHGVPAS